MELAFLPSFLWIPGRHWEVWGQLFFIPWLTCRPTCGRTSFRKALLWIIDLLQIKGVSYLGRDLLACPWACWSRYCRASLKILVLPAPYDLLLTLQEEIKQFSSCSNCWSSCKLVSIPLLSQEQALPGQLVVVVGGAKHQGSGNVGEGAAGGQVLVSFAFPCSSCLVYDSCSNCFMFCPSFPTLGVFQIMAKMVRRTCAFCSEGEAGSVMYIAKEQNVAAHQDCLVSGFWLVST